MVKTGFLTLLLLVIGVVAFGTTQAYADPDGAGDALAYAYYDIRGASNYMVVNDSATTAPKCMVRPTDEDIFFYYHLDATVPGTNAPDVRPVASTIDGHNVDIRVDIGPFCEPMHVSLSAFAPVVDPEEIWFLDSWHNLNTLSDEAVEEGKSGQTTTLNDSQNGDHGSGPGHQRHKKKFRNLIHWKANVLEVTEDLKTELPSGLYVITLSVTPSRGDHENYYRWVTLFIVP
jgi:hypothetical protein